MSIIERPAPARRGLWARTAAAFAVAFALIAAGGVSAANASPGDLLVSGGPTLTTSSNTLVAGSAITISGSGYNSTTAEGVYVSFGWVDSSDWRPSASAPSTNRVTKQTVWVRTGTIPSGATDQVNWSTTGNGTASFSFSFTPQAPRTNPGSNNTFYVYTVNGHNVPSASNEQAREVLFPGTKDTSTPPAGGQGQITAFAIDANTIQVDGSGYTGVPSTGIYVSTGTLADAGWKPSAGYASSTRVASDTVWVYAAGPATQSGGTKKLNSDGTFSVTLSKSSVPNPPSTGTHRAAYTIGAHGIARALSEWETTIP